MAITIIPSWADPIAEGMVKFGVGMGEGYKARKEREAEEKKNAAESLYYEKYGKYLEGLTPDKEPKGMLRGYISDATQGDMSPSSSFENFRVSSGLNGINEKMLEGVVTPPMDLRYGTEGKKFAGRDPILEKAAEATIDVNKAGVIDILDTLKDQTGKTVTSIQNLNRVTNAMSGMVATAKQAMKEQGGAGIVPSLTGNVKRLYADLGVDKNISPSEQMSGMPKFKGQAREVTLALSPILTGSTRIMASVLSMLGETIPQDLNKSEATVVGQLKQTYKNAFRLSIGLAQAGLTKEDIASLEENATEEQIRKLLQGVMNKAAMSPEDETAFEELWKKVKETPADEPETFGDDYEKYLQTIGAK